MRPTKINDRALIRLIDQGKTQVAVAKILGVSKQAINKRLQELRGKTTRVVVAKKIEAVVEKKIDAMAQITKINLDANEILDGAMALVRGDDASGDDAKSDIKDPNELALKAMAEIKGQIKLQFEIFKGLCDMRAVEDFQREVLRAIGEESLETRNRIIARLNNLREIKSIGKIY